MNKNTWLLLVMIFMICTITLSVFTYRSATIFPLSNNCDKYIDIIKNTSGIIKHNALTDYNMCTAKDLNSTAIIGLDKTKVFIYFSIVSFVLLIISTLNFIISNKKSK